MIYDAIIIGGGFAGLSAATPLVRARRRVLVIDAGRSRNRFAAHSHGVLAHDGRSGRELLATARAQLAEYPDFTLWSGEVLSLQQGDGAFSAHLDGARRADGRRVILATGVSDPLPEIPGLAERWGKTVLHCPYCHGYEVGGGQIGVLANTPMSMQQASLIADWGDVTFFTNGHAVLDETSCITLARRKVRVETVAVRAVEGEGTALSAVRLADGRAVPVRALFVSVRAEQSSSLAGQLGCEFEDTPGGLVVRTDAWKLSSVPHVYAAGDAARFPQNISFACADGVAAGIGVHHSLIAEEIGAI
ncbi:NAD(P)/FAD-dependent oxidoreductase [Janthinobacterium fluminis]|uniref:NAD(P)/FAD-dependent oxidoreductase n=1 Tax=Janthinobacterium fluminis TaxID=2987524 RepID=A0ABT5K8T7_9BURK|nr:NAD(P)/FAD-dependent oxidoreductase [Janthinobacterium fluminis]MDC8760900.1 NAD(P)/FAD-dependent oxidoreductase [Janthinobacterium fluminis]